MQSHYIKPFKKDTKKLLQCFLFLNDIDISSIDDLFEKRTPQIDNPFHIGLSLIINPFTSEKYGDSEVKTLLSQII